MHNKNDSKKDPLTLLEIAEAAKKRVTVISKEFSDGFEFLKNYPRSVTFFGSARTKGGEADYEKARRIASKIVNELHYSVITGGGPGIMEAANRGAFEAGGNSLGLTIKLPTEQKVNPYITDQVDFYYFFSRKVCLSFSSEAYVFFPGGFGTMDEFFEILTLVQTNKIPQTPIILVGKEYWQGLQDFFIKHLEQTGRIDGEDLRLYTITDDENEIIEAIKKAPVQIGLRYNEESEIPTNNNHTGDKDLPAQTGRPISYLTEKHCVPCEGGTPKLSREESEGLLKEVSNWTLIEDKEIEKTYTFKDFREALDFMDQVGTVAEKEGHHPDLKLHDYKKVDVRISTHAIDGLSENDFILAAKIDELTREK